jgi:hypothetical protein
MSSIALPMNVAKARYEAPALLDTSGAPAETKEWAIIGLALALVLIWYGSAWAFCWAVCHGRVSSCSTGGAIWARTVTAVCHR